MRGVVVNGMGRILINIYLLEVVCVGVVYAVLQLFDYYKFLSPIYIDYEDSFYENSYSLMFFVLLYLFSVYAYKRIHTRFLSFKRLYAEVIACMVIYSFVGCLSSSVSYLITDVVLYKGGIDSALLSYMSNPRLFLVAIALPFFPLYSWVGGLINGVFLILYRQYVKREQS